MSSPRFEAPTLPPRIRTRRIAHYALLLAAALVGLLCAPATSRPHGAVLVSSARR